jgi:chemotaxis response regulator CheB
MSDVRGAATRQRVLLATSDPVFGVLCQKALETGSSLQFLVAVPPPELLATVRRFAPDLVILDADGQDVAAFKALATKVMLVSDAPLVVVSAYLSPGAPGLCVLLQSISARFVQKPRGATSLDLADEDGPPFAAALQAAFAAQEDGGLATDDLDVGTDDPDPRISQLDAEWNIEPEPVSSARRSDG